MLTIIAEPLITMEVTSEEQKMILKKREKDAHIALRNSYIDELNDLIARMTADGFTLGNKSSSSYKLREAKPWGDASDCWIEIK